MRGRRLLIVLGVAYAIALGASHLARQASRGRPSLAPATIAAGGSTSNTTGSFLIKSLPATDVRIAYRSWGQRRSPTDPPLLLLHGSPGSSRDFEELGAHLGHRYLVLAPDLPGFGASQRTVPDYSVAAHADYSAEFLDALDIDRVHVLGFSMGGGVALELAARRPEHVLSMTLLSSIGAQEFELLGNYFLNRGVHAMQLGALWALHELVPHFGLLDGFPLDVPYARNFYDTDQRPLREILGTLAMPTLIVHGQHDFLVPAAAAHEHHRLVPQSELVMLDSDHFMVFRAPEILAPPIEDFLSRFEEGAATHRTSSSLDRLAAARESFDPSTIPAASGISLAVLIALLALATFVSEDTTCIATGLLVSQGRLGFLAGSAACAAGILIGDLLIYAAGRYLGRPWLGRAPLRWMLSPRALARSREWFERRGAAVIVGSRFLPGTRVAAYFTAGLLKTPFRKFLGYFTVAVVIWTPLLVGLSTWMGAQLFEYFGAFERWALPGVIALAVVFSMVFSLARQLASWSGRRRLLGALRRKLEWEFWPWWLIYLPLFPWILWLGLKHRGLTVFTAANPGIEAGGFVGESKADILGAIDPNWVPRFRLIPAGQPSDARVLTAREFMGQTGLKYPVVVKPDIGERGAGVAIVRSDQQLRQIFETSGSDLLIQEYVAGPELGVFYIRHPGEERGRIFSITEKRLLSLTGDGHSTVEELVLRDERAMRMAPRHLDNLSDQVDRVPALAEAVPLGELGVHSRGALFLDGAHLDTPQLQQTIEEIASSVEGFFFGRFDLRAPSLDSFKSGQEIKVLELNGVTSEATHIYDPGNSFFAALAVLRRQWSLAFEIGSQNRARGFPPIGLGSLLRLIGRHLFARS